MDRPYMKIRTPGHRRELSASELLEVGPGRRYPKLLLLVSLFLLLLMLGWLPTITEKDKGPLAFVWPLNQTRDTKLLIRPSEISTIIQPSQVCEPEDPSSFPYLLVIVCSALKNFEARSAIRNSWAQHQKNQKNVKVIFLLGQEVNATNQQALLEEAEKYGDILQEDFIDTYANLTVKSVMLLKWFHQNCDISKKLRTEYVLKTDDDIYVNLPKLYDLARANKKPNLLVGSLICNAVPIKDPHNKWFVPQYMFNEKKYPNYLSGTGYLMQRETAAKIYSAALETKLFHLEDIYITGILSRKVRIRPSDNIGFSYVRRTLNSCLFRETITTHQIKPKEMLDIYKKLNKTRSAKCPKLKLKQIRSYGPVRCVWR